MAFQKWWPVWYLPKLFLNPFTRLQPICFFNGYNRTPGNYSYKIINEKLNSQGHFFFASLNDLGPLSLVLQHDREVRGGGNLIYEVPRREKRGVVTPWVRAIRGTRSVFATYLCLRPVGPFESKNTPQNFFLPSWEIQDLILEPLEHKPDTLAMSYWVLLFKS